MVTIVIVICMVEVMAISYYSYHIILVMGYAWVMRWWMHARWMVEEVEVEVDRGRLLGVARRPGDHSSWRETFSNFLNLNIRLLILARETFLTN